MRPRQREEPNTRHFDHKRLRAARKAAGLSGVEFAKQVGRETTYGYERGNIIPSIPLFRRMAQLLKLDLFEILEIMHLTPVDPSDLKVFRATCKAEGVTPDEAIRRMIKVYADLKLEGE